MKEDRILSLKSSYGTILSIILVCFIFLLQLFLIYNLYKTNTEVLQRELNMVTYEAYTADLERRAEKLRVEEREPDIRYYGSKKPSEVTDTTKVLVIDRKKGDIARSRMEIMLAITEEYTSLREPIDVEPLDSTIAIYLKKRNIENSFYSEIVNIENDSVLQTTFKPGMSHIHTMTSIQIPVNARHTKMLQVKLLDPFLAFSWPMLIMLLLSLLLCLICIRSFRTHRRYLTREQEANRIKSKLFSNISHDTKKPLQVLAQVISYFQSCKEIDNDTTRRFLRIAMSEITKMNLHNEMIMTMTQEDEGFLELDCSSFNLKEAVDTVVRYFEDTALNPQTIKVFNNLGDREYVYADKKYLIPAISNLIENSIKYARKKVPPEVVITLSRDNNMVYISVKDNGIGISQKDQLRIFERYIRLEQPGVKAGGHGIGLDYTKRIVERHHGKITVISEVNEGSEFIICLPEKK